MKNSRIDFRFLIVTSLLFTWCFPRGTINTPSSPVGLYQSSSDPEALYFIDSGKIYFSKWESSQNRFNPPDIISGSYTGFSLIEALEDDHFIACYADQKIKIIKIDITNKAGSLVSDRAIPTAAAPKNILP